MPTATFATTHSFDPTGSAGSSNILALLRNPAGYSVVYNQPDGWIVDLEVPFQGVSLITFLPPAGGSFTPGAGEDPPLGVVGAISFSATLAEDPLVRFEDLATLGFTAGQLISDTTRLVSGVDQFFGSDVDNFPFGDTFFAGAGDDVLAGVGANDFLAGDAGDDIVAGGEGNDTLDGGADFDQASYFDAPSDVEVSLALQGSPQNTLWGNDTLSNFEGLVGSGFDDTLSGNDGANVLHGLQGRDELFGETGADSLLGGPDADSLFGGAGDDVMDGGDGFDTVGFLTANAGVAVSLALQGVAQNTGDGLDTLVSIENLRGSSFNDVLTGSPLGNDLSGGDGDDILEGGAGADDLVGGAGADTLNGGTGVDDSASYQLSGAGVSVNLAMNTAVGGDATGDSLSGVEHLSGSAFDDSLTGDGGRNSLVGDAGDDVLHGLEGDDVLFGAQGEDWLFGGGGDDTLVVSNGLEHVFGGTEGADAGNDSLLFNLAGPVVVQLGPGYAANGGVTLATLSGIENVSGTLSDDAIIGDAANNRIAGAAGADWLVGGGGDDTFIVGLEGGGLDRLFGGTAGADSGVDTIDLSSANADVVVQLGPRYAVSGGVTLATFHGIENAVGGSANDALIGDGGNNRLTGGAGSDWLVGQGGDDWFVQGTQAGVDRLFGDAGTDTIDYGAAATAVTVQLNGWSTLSGGATLATFTGIENAVGSAFNDALIGSAANNVLIGGAGADWLVGAGGNDVFVQTLDTTSIDRLFGGTPGADAGLDTIDYAPASTGVVVQLSGYATTNGGGAVTLATFSGIENAAGSNFADALIGNASNNAIIGRAGADWLVGGGGADLFVYQALEASQDSIRDFSRAQGDRIHLSDIDANPLTGADDAFIFATIRHAGVLGEAVVTNFGGSSLVSLYLDADNIADMTIQVVHQQGLVMNPGDFVL